MKLASKEITLKILGELAIDLVIGLIGGFIVLMIAYYFLSPFAKAISLIASSPISN